MQTCSCLYPWTGPEDVWTGPDVGCNEYGSCNIQGVNPANPVNGSKEHGYNCVCAGMYEGLYCQNEVPQTLPPTTSSPTTTSSPATTTPTTMSPATPTTRTSSPSRHPTSHPSSPPSVANVTIVDAPAIQTESQDDLLVILGATLGGLAFVGAVVGVIVYCLRHKPSANGMDTGGGGGSSGL